VTEDSKDPDGATEASPETAYVDLQDETTPSLSAVPPLENTSDVLYMVREANVLSDLNEALETSGVDLIEEV